MNPPDSPRVLNTRERSAKPAVLSFARRSASSSSASAAASSRTRATLASRS